LFCPQTGWKWPKGSSTVLCFFSCSAVWGKKWLDLFFYYTLIWIFCHYLSHFSTIAICRLRGPLSKAFFAGLPSINFGFIYLFISFSTNHKAKKLDLCARPAVNHFNNINSVVKPFEKTRL